MYKEETKGSKKGKQNTRDVLNCSPIYKAHNDLLVNTDVTMSSFTANITDLALIVFIKLRLSTNKKRPFDP